MLDVETLQNISCKLQYIQFLVVLLSHQLGLPGSGRVGCIHFWDVSGQTIALFLFSKVFYMKHLLWNKIKYCLNCPNDSFYVMMMIIIICHNYLPTLERHMQALITTRSTNLIFLFLKEIATYCNEEKSHCLSSRYGGKYQFIHWGTYFHRVTLRTHTLYQVYLCSFKIPLSFAVLDFRDCDAFSHPAKFCFPRLLQACWLPPVTV